MWFLPSLICGLTFAANRLLIRSVFTKHSNPMIFGAVHELLAGLFLLPIGIFFFSLPQSPKTWLALSLGIFFIFLCDLFGFLALRKIEVSLLQIINQLRHIVVLLGAYLLFAEIISPTKVISIFFIMFGVFVALVGKSKITMNKETLYAFLSTISISCALLFIKMASADVAPAFSGTLSLIISGVLIYVLLIVRGEKPAKLIPIEHRKQLFIAAGIFAVFELAFFTALAVGEASKVTPVTQSSMIFTLIGGYVFLNERNHMKQKIIGSLLIAIGIILLYVIR